MNKTPNAKSRWPILRRLLVGLAMLATLLAIFYTEENWRGKRAWESCKRDLEAKGAVLDWDKYIPPPVPDDQNFFKAPKMAEWFVKINGQFTNELTARLNHPDTTAVTIGELTVLPPPSNLDVGSESADLALRYSSFGSAVFLADDSLISTNALVIPLILFDDVPLTTAVENLARQVGIRYLLDPKIDYNRTGENGEIKPEPVMSVRWENITARQALLALLNKYDLQLVDESNAGVARITMKASGAPGIYISPAAREKITQLFQNVLGLSAAGSQGFALSMKPLAQIKPVRIVLYSEKVPDEKERAALSTEISPGNFARLGSPFIRIEPAGTNLFRLMANSISAADYLKWSDQFQPDYNLMREALKRPCAVIPGDYSKPFEQPIPNFVTMRVIAQALAQRAQCYLLLNRPEAALPELTLMHDVCRILEKPPTGKPETLVEAMINVAIAGLYVAIVQEGFRLHAWQAPQQAALQAQLAEINLPPWIALAFQAEQAGTCHAAELVQPSQISRVGLASAKRTIWKKIMDLPNHAIDLAPRGWVYQNMAVCARMIQIQKENVLDANQNVIPGRTEMAAKEIAKTLDNNHSPFYLLAKIAIPNFTRAMQVCAFNQTLANEAQIACALERYHLAHGEYPETLDALMPQFIEKIPHDIIGGEPLHYRRTEDGKFLLYTVGWNETDDGGLPGTLADVKTGDWVWPYPQK